MFDLSLYLVTSSDRLPRGATVESVVKEAIRGGVTIVQLREKELSTQLFLKRAQSLRKICQGPVKLIINDRIDIALASGADGVHLGQDDMPIASARKLLGDQAIIGISVNTIAEARSAVEQGATYLGIGTCWPTGTKQIPDHKVIGPKGVKLIRDELVGLEKSTPLVVIGGINSTNLIRTLYGCTSSQLYNPKKTETAIGIAVVSAIMSSKHPFEEAVRLKGLIQEFQDWLKIPRALCRYPPNKHFDKELSATLSKLMKSNSTPLIHHITNTVVQNDCANLTLSYGCSPIMSSNSNELEELVDLQPGCLVINLGSFDDQQLEAMRLAGRKANLIGKPIIFDPAGVDANPERLKKAHALLNHVQMSVIKGNVAELLALSSLKGSKTTPERAHDPNDPSDSAGLVALLARQELCIVVLTGKVDWVSDGRDVFRLANGSPQLASITGCGSMVGTSIACFASAVPQSNDNSSQSGLLRCMGDIQHHNMGQTKLSAIVGVSTFNLVAQLLSEVLQVASRLSGPINLKSMIIDKIHRAKSQGEDLWILYRGGSRISFVSFT